MKNTKKLLFVIMLSAPLALRASDQVSNGVIDNIPFAASETIEQDRQARHAMQAKRLGCLSAASWMLLGTSVLLQRNGSSLAQDSRFAKGQLLLAGSALTTTGLAVHQAYQAKSNFWMPSFAKFSNLWSWKKSEAVQEVSVKPKD